MDKLGPPSTCAFTSQSTQTISTLCSDLAFDICNKALLPFWEHVCALNEKARKAYEAGSPSTSSPQSEEDWKAVGSSTRSSEEDWQEVGSLTRSSEEDWKAVDSPTRSSEEDWKAVDSPTRSPNFSTESADAGFEEEDRLHSDSGSVDYYEAGSGSSSSLAEAQEAHSLSIRSGPTGESSFENRPIPENHRSVKLKIWQDDPFSTWTTSFYSAAWLSPTAGSDAHIFSKDASTTATHPLVVPGFRGTRRMPLSTDMRPLGQIAESPDSGRTGPLLDAGLTMMDQPSASDLYDTNMTYLISCEMLLLDLVNAPREESETPLPVAVSRPDRKAMVEHVLKLGAGLEKKSPSGMTPLHQAVRTFSPEVVEVLLNASANVEAKTSTGWTALHHAVDVNSVEKVKLLIRYRADVNARARHDVTPLHQACRARNLDIVDALLKAGARVTDRNTYQRTPLHYAVLAGDLDIVQCLLYCKAWTDVHDVFGMTAETYAEELGYDDIAQVMKLCAAL